jgi:hypothetical protein
MANGIFLVPLLLVLVFSNATIIYATESGMRATTSKGTLDILVEPTWSEGEDGRANAIFRVSFLNPGTDTLHKHQDYDFRILKDGIEIFSAAKQTGQVLIHNVEGTITIPYTFQENGDYTIQIFLAGTGIAPTIPTDEHAIFQIHVVTEFPVALAALAVMMTTAIMLVRYRRHS